MELNQLENGFFIAFFKMDSYAMHMYDKNFHITIFPSQCRIDGKISERWALISIFDVAHNLSHILYGTAIQENISFHRIQNFVQNIENILPFMAKCLNWAQAGWVEKRINMFSYLNRKQDLTTLTFALEVANEVGIWYRFVAAPLFVGSPICLFACKHNQWEYSWWYT